MNRRNFLHAAAGAAALNAVPGFATTVPSPPRAGDTPYFRSLGSTWSGNVAGATMRTDLRNGLSLLEVEWSDTDPRPVVEAVSRVATQDRRIDFSVIAPQALGRAELARYLLPTQAIPLDGIVQATARAATRGVRGDDVDKARAIYEWIVDNTFRDPKTIGCGRGDIRFMLESGNLGGKCADLNTLFVGLARAVGIPARDVYGVRCADSTFGFKSLGKSGDITRAQHCRAEFWSAKHGWVPVDPADVRKVVLEEPPGNLALDQPKVKQAREMLFGAWEMNWLALNHAHDVALPGSAGKPLPFLMYPQAEINERVNPYAPDEFRYRITSREIVSA